MFFHYVNNIEYNVKKYLHWHGENLSYTSIILYIKTVKLKNDASREITNFQRDLFLKEHS